jgi:translation elongation factor EF-G
MMMMMMLITLPPGPHTPGFMDMLRDHVPSPVANAANKIQHIYAGALSSEVGRDMLACNPDGQLMLHITKLYPSQDATSFDAFGRVLSGTIDRASSVKVGQDGLLASRSLSSWTMRVCESVIMSTYLLSFPSYIALLSECIVIAIFEDQSCAVSALTFSVSTRVAPL